MDLLGDYPEFEYHLTLQESVAVGMGESYARSTETASCVMLHVDSGLANGICLMLDALNTGTPMVVMSASLMPGTVTIGMQVGGPTRLNISSQPPDSSPERAVPELNRLGLEHFGFHVENLEAETARFEAEGIRVILPLTVTPQGIKLAYIEGPDDVVIELVQAAP